MSGLPLITSRFVLRCCVWQGGGERGTTGVWVSDQEGEAGGEGRGRRRISECVVYVKITS